MAQLRTPEAHDLTVAVQDYAKAIFTLESRDGAASTTDLAALLEVRPASVSGMLRKLSALGLVEHERYRGVRLTERGRRVALEVIRHHRLVELFLVESLGMTWDEVHAEPEMLRFLGERGIVPGARLKLVERQPFDGPLFVRVGRNVHVLGATLARAMHVQREQPA